MEGITPNAGQGVGEGFIDREITPIMENQMENKLENEVETCIIGWFIGFPTSRLLGILMVSKALHD